MTLVDKSTRSPTFGEASKPFRDAGVPSPALLPIAPPDAVVADNSSLARNRKSLGKVPGRFDAHRQEWTGLGGNAITQGLDKRTRACAENWPTGNVGIVCRAFPAIDCDVNSDAARELVERAVRMVLGATYAERLRGGGPRRLFAFRSDPKLQESRRVRKATWEFRLPGDRDDAPPHKVDILGYGQQFVATGTHPSGDAYEWHAERDLCEMVRADRVEFIESADIDRLRQEFESTVRKIGGTVHVSGDNGRGAGSRRAHDYSREDPIADTDRILDALDRVPNTEANFPQRDDLIGVLSAVRAAAGRRALDQDFEDQVRGWAVDTSEGFCDEDYFNKIWGSLRSGVRCGRDRLSVILRDHGVHDFDGIDFEDDGGAFDAANASRKIDGHKAADRAMRAAKNSPLLTRAANAYVFQRMGTGTGAASRNIRQPMRLKAFPEWPWSAADWWDGKTTDQNTDILQELHVNYPDKKTGLYDFLRDLENAHPFAFFTREIRHPGFDYGEVAERFDTRGNPDGALNVRQRSQAQNAADKPRRNIDLAKADKNHFLDFMHRGFGGGEVTEYLLDTLAYMVQTGKRPGHMLVIEGVPGVGKSFFAEFLIALFDGMGSHVRSRIDGSKFMNKDRLKFVFGQIEGCRICSIKELPPGSGHGELAALVSTVKQMVDAGSGGNYIDIERKGVDSQSVENHSYFIATTNYENVFPIEESDRRLLPVRFRITKANRPAQKFYDRLGAIMDDPERLAAVWDYLADRAIGHYRADAPPPVTAEKASAQYLSMEPSVRHVAVALDTLVHAGRGLATQYDIVPLMNWAARVEDGDDGDDGGLFDLYKVGSPIGSASGGPAPIRGKALRLLVERTRRRETKIGRGSAQSRAPTVYALKGCGVPIDDMQWDELSAALGTDRRNHPIREGVQAKPYNVRIDPMAPVIDRIAGDDADDADAPDRGNVINMPARRRG